MWGATTPARLAGASQSQTRRRNIHGRRPHLSAAAALAALCRPAGPGHRGAPRPDRRPGRGGGVAVRPGGPAGAAGRPVGPLGAAPPGGGGGGPGPGDPAGAGEAPGQAGAAALPGVGAAAPGRQRPAVLPALPVHQLQQFPRRAVSGGAAGPGPLAGVEAGAGAGPGGGDLPPGPGGGAGLLPGPGGLPDRAPPCAPHLDGGRARPALRRPAGAGPAGLWALCRLPGGQCDRTPPSS